MLQSIMIDRYEKDAQGALTRLESAQRNGDQSLCMAGPRRNQRSATFLTTRMIFAIQSKLSCCSDLIIDDENLRDVDDVLRNLRCATELSMAQTSH